MFFFRPIPRDIIQADEETAVDLYIKREDKLELFLQKDTVYTSDHLSELQSAGISSFYIKGRDKRRFDRYTTQHIEKIIKNPSIPPKVKADALYRSSSDTMRQAFEEPRAEHLDEIKKSVNPLLKNIMKNEDILKELFAITQHDYYTYTHSVNVGIFATALAIRYFNTNGSKLDVNMERLSYGYFLHDIGKARIPLSVLNKPGKLSEDEWVVMKMHPEWGYSILMETGHLTDEAAYIALQHHEQLDGTGYPFGKKANSIHPCARICAIADTFDALTSVRPYKGAITPYEALKLMQKGILYDFDYNLLTTFINLLAP